jgi:hypothetical protein
MSNTVNIYVNKADIGLDLVDNTSDLNKPISTATQTALNGKEDKSNKSTDVNLGNSDTLYPTQLAVKTYVDSNIVSVPDATASVKGIVKLAGDLGGTADSPTVPSLSGKETKQAPQVASTQFKFDGRYFHAVTGGGGNLAGLTGNITLWGGVNYVGSTSYMLHNDSVEPTFSSDFERQADSLPYVTGADNLIVATCVNQYPYKISYRIERPGTNIYSTFLTTDLKGANNGLAELDGTGKVPSSQLPSYVDDVLEYANLAAFPVTGTTATIYLALDTNLTYRWGGSSYIEISPSLALGETSSSAYRGDRGKIAYDHSQLTSGNPHNVSKSDVGLSNVVNSDTTTTANITDSSNKRFVTDAQLTVIGNTSGTNTGDQDLSSYATKNLTLDRKTASYTLVAGDNNKLIEMNVATANNVTINNSVFTAGNQILVSQYGAGQVTFVAGAGVTLRSPSGKLKLTGQYSLATIIAISATEFYISGDLTA